MIIAAIGAIMIAAIVPTKPSGLSSSSPPPNSQLNWRKLAIAEMAAPIMAATVVTSTSRFLTCASSWASTPRTSSRGRYRSSPSVTATAALLGLRPVANAFGCSDEITKSRGIGMPARPASSSTSSYTVGASSRASGCARLILSAIRSENQNIAKLKATASSAARISPAVPPTTKPSPTKRAVSPEMSTQVRRRVVMWWRASFPADGGACQPEVSPARFSRGSWAGATRAPFAVPF